MNGKIRKALKKIGITTAGILGIIALFLGCLCICHQARLRKERSIITHLAGQYVEIDGHNLNVYVEGEGDKTLVFLPGSMTPSPIMPGVQELMAQIQADGITIGIVTGSGQRPLIARLLDDFGRFLSVDHIVTAYDVNRGKPAADPYLAGLKKVGGLQPWQAMVVENAPLGVEAGVAARIFTIAVNTGPLPEEMLADKGANIVFKSMIDLSSQWREVYTPSSSTS